MSLVGGDDNVVPVLRVVDASLCPGFAPTVDVAFPALLRRLCVTPAVTYAFMGIDEHAPTEQAANVVRRAWIRDTTAFMDAVGALPAQTVVSVQLPVSEGTAGAAAVSASQTTPLVSFLGPSINASAADAVKTAVCTPWSTAWQDPWLLLRSLQDLPYTMAAPATAAAASEVASVCHCMRERVPRLHTCERCGCPGVFSPPPHVQFVFVTPRK